MWQTYDYYLDCNGGYYGCKYGCEPVKAVFDPRTEEIVVSNATPNTYSDLTVNVILYNLNGRKLDRISHKIDKLLSDTYGLVVWKMDFSKSDTDICFIETELDGVSTTYWHNRAVYQDYRAIGVLPEPILELEYEGNTLLSVRNIGDTPSVCTRMQIVDDNGNDILPVFWSDNYITLMPGDRCRVNAQFSSPSSKSLHFKVNSYSVPLL
jgi:hypothetical protein